MFYLDPDSPLSLQGQLRQKIVEAIMVGSLVPDRRLPSSRKLAAQLGVARNTVVLAYQQLIDEGYLLTRERSGIYVNEAVLARRVNFQGTADVGGSVVDWAARLPPEPERDQFQAPPDWQRYPYPFIDGYYDQTLFPVHEWREASRLALGVGEVNAWSRYRGDADDPELIEAIRTQLLPARGIQVGSDQVLLVPGVHAARGLLASLLVARGTAVTLEEPGSPAWRALLAERGARLDPRPLDAEGLCLPEPGVSSELLLVTPSHQLPTGVTMSTQRRQAVLTWAAGLNALVIEDDHAAETNYLGQPHPALFGMDSEGRVLYLSSLARVLSSSLQLAFIVAPAEVVQAARRLRRKLFGAPPRNNQRAMAYFLSLGHYDSFHRRLDEVFRGRWLALRDALNHYLPNLVVTAPSQGGTAWWVTGPDWLDARLLAREAGRRGVLIEPVGHFFGADTPPDNCFRLGLTSLDEGQIRAGVATLAAVIRDLSGSHTESLDNARGERLGGALLRSRLAGAVLHFNTVYGDPATVHLHSDGSMEGEAGYAGEDNDRGKWWVEGDLWYRQWQQWSYGKTLGLYVVIDGNQIKWFDRERQLVDAAHIQWPGREP